MEKIFYVLLSTENYKERQHLLLNTWLKNTDGKFIILSDGYDSHTNSIKISEHTDYKGAEYKAINGCNLLGLLPKIAEWYFFCDDDTYVSVNNLNQMVNSLVSTYSLGEVITHENSPLNPIFRKYDNDLKYFAGGGGFLIHNSNLNNLAQFKFFESGYGDVSIGLNMRILNMPLVNSPLFHSQHFNFPGYKNKINIDDISFHYIRDIESCTALKKIIG